MRKFVLTDRDGKTATGQALAPGKFVEAARNKSSVLARIHDCTADSELLAALVSPLPSQEARMFSINCWNVAVDPKNEQSYTVVKETEAVPAVTPVHRLRFAMLLAVETFRDREFKRWANNWLSGVDTSIVSARAALASLEKELAAAADLAEMEAWGETGTDPELGRRRDDGAQRARHVLRAVDMMDSPEQAASAAMEITEALVGLSRLPASMPLAAMGELATSDEMQLRKTAG